LRCHADSSAATTRPNGTLDSRTLTLKEGTSRLPPLFPANTVGGSRFVDPRKQEFKKGIRGRALCTEAEVVQSHSIICRDQRPSGELQSENLRVSGSRTKPLNPARRDSIWNAVDGRREWATGQTNRLGAGLTTPGSQSGGSISAIHGGSVGRGRSRPFEYCS